MVREYSSILIAESNLEICNSVSKRLTSFDKGFTVFTANTFQEAITVLQGNPIDLAILDLVFLGKNYRGILRDLKIQYPNTYLAIAGNRGNIYYTYVTQAGADDYFNKLRYQEKLTNLIHS
jgi:DNA-binding response OmpR family regulator